jgi:cytochrome c biogenesis protein CcmG/thiol:disulfide interchange protein DsbE
VAPQTEQAPAFTAAMLGGGEQAFEPTRLTHPTLFVFWASWCTSCKAELPLVLDIDKSRKGALDILGVSVDEQPERAEAYARDAQLPYQSFTDSTLVVADKFGVKGTPSFVLVAKSGEVRYVGKAVDEGLLTAIDQAVR